MGPSPGSRRTGRLPISVVPGEREGNAPEVRGHGLPLARRGSAPSRWVRGGPSARAPRKRPTFTAVFPLGTPNADRRQPSAGQPGHAWRRSLPRVAGATPPPDPTGSVPLG